MNIINYLVLATGLTGVLATGLAICLAICLATGLAICLAICLTGILAAVLAAGLTRVLAAHHVGCGGRSRCGICGRCGSVLLVVSWGARSQGCERVHRILEETTHHVGHIVAAGVLAALAFCFAALAHHHRHHLILRLAKITQRKQRQKVIVGLSVFGF